MKIRILFFIILFISPFINSQNRAELTFTTGYQMLGSVSVYQGEIDINDSQFFEGNLALRIRPNILIELSYIHQSTAISLDPFGSVPEFKLFDATVHYILGGAIYERYFSRTVVGYGRVSLGAAGFVPDANFDSEWRFAFAPTLGLKIFLNRNIGIKLQAQGLFPVEWTGGSIWVGSGGLDYGVGAGSSITQINVGAGIFYSL